MTQTRIWNYGDTFTSFRGSSALGELHSPGVFSGYDLSVTDVDKVEVSTGFLLLPSGILVGEDVALEFIINPLPAAATTYTLTVRHTDSDVIGGQAAVYAMEVGELAPADISDGIPIAYIHHPGGAVALDASQIVPVRKVLDSASDAVSIDPTSFLAPFSSAWVVDTLGTDTSVTSSYDGAATVYSSVSTGGASPLVPPFFETSVMVIPIEAKAFRPRSFSVRSRIATINSSLVVSAMDTDGNPVSLSSSTISGPSAVFSASTVTVDSSSGVFTEGDLYTLVLEFRTPQSESIDIQSFTVIYDPLP